MRLSDADTGVAAGAGRRRGDVLVATVPGQQLDAGRRQEKVDTASCPARAMLTGRAGAHYITEPRPGLRDVSCSNRGL